MWDIVVFVICVWYKIYFEIYIRVLNSVKLRILLFIGLDWNLSFERCNCS